MTSTNAPLLEIVSSLCESSERAGSRPDLTAERLEDSLDVALRGDPDNGNRFLYVLRSFRVPASIASVELRVPLRGATRKGPLCVLELSRSGPPAAELEDVARTFGEASRTLSPRGFAARRGARSRESFLVYDRPWGAIRFGTSSPSEAPSPEARPAVDPATRRRPVLTTIVIDIER